MKCTVCNPQSCLLINFAWIAVELKISNTGIYSIKSLWLANEGCLSCLLHQWSAFREGEGLWCFLQICYFVMGHRWQWQAQKKSALPSLHFNKKIIWTKYLIIVFFLSRQTNVTVIPQEASVRLWSLSPVKGLRIWAVFVSF